jgi:hypothetical protein
VIKSKEYITMERTIGTSHWDSAVKFMRQHPDRMFIFAKYNFENQDFQLGPGWEYVVERHDGNLFCVTYKDGMKIKSIPV